MTDFWRGRSVLVTGGSGFLGKYVVRKLREQEACVYNADHKHYDLRCQADIRRALDDAKPQTIIHLAAHVGGIGANQQSPAEMFYDNAMMGIQLLHEAWRAGVEKVVLIGTVCCYPKHTLIPFSEDSLWDGYPEETNAPYGMAKKMLLVQSQAYRAQYDFNSIFLMPTNLFGPGDNFDANSSHVIPALIRKCAEAKAAGLDRITLWGDGSPTREFLYVEDAAEGIVLAAERYDRGQPVNLGGTIEVSITEVAALIASLTRFEGDIAWDKSKPNGQPRRKVDVRRAREQFGFEARTSFSDGLIRTVEWYRESTPAQSVEVIT